MLDKLIESRSHLNESRRRGGILLTTSTAVFSALTLALIYSLFSYNLAMANESLDVSSLVAPVPASEPPPPETIVEPKQQNNVKTIDKLQTRVVNMTRVSEIPKDLPPVSAVPNISLARPNAPFQIGPVDSIKPSSGLTREGRISDVSNNSAGISRPATAAKLIDDDDKPPVKAATPKAVPTQGIIRTSKILNGQAINLVKPLYPVPAKMVHAAGAVNVQVTIDENGNVTSANALSGHPLLRQVSEQAARNSKFNPTFLNYQKVKVTGVIVYNFIAQ